MGAYYIKIPESVFLLYFYDKLNVTRHTDFPPITFSRFMAIWGICQKINFGDFIRFGRKGTVYPSFFCDKNQLAAYITSSTSTLYRSPPPFLMRCLGTGTTRRPWPCSSFVHVHVARHVRLRLIAFATSKMRAQIR